MKALGLAIATLGLLASASVATADTYTLVNFSGGIFGGNANVQPPFTSFITQGESFTGSFVYDDALVPGAGSGLVNVFRSSFPDAVPNITFSIGPYSYAITDPNAAIQYNNGHFNGFSINEAFSVNNTPYELEVSGGTFGVFLISGGFPTFNSSVNGYINIGDAALTGATPFIPTVSPGVPEPSTWAMMLLGLAGLGFVARRRQSLAPAAAS